MPALRNHAITYARLYATAHIQILVDVLNATKALVSFIGTVPLDYICNAYQ